MKKRALIGIIILTALVGACSEGQKALPENATIYDKAVANPIRPKADIEDDKSRKPTDILAFSGLEQGMTAIDLLAGGGYYTELFSHIVGPEGKVYFHNSSRFLSTRENIVIKRLENNRLPNVVRLDSDLADLKLPADVDLLFLGKVYHDIYVSKETPLKASDRDNFFRQLRESLKTGGKILLIDHNGEPGSGNKKTGSLHRIDEKFAREDFETAGFKYIDQLSTLRNPNDDLSLNIWDGNVRGKTDRFIYLFEAP